MVGPLAARLLTALGVSLVSIGGLVAATTALKAAITQSLGSIPGDALQLLGLFGIWTCLGLVFGCITFVLTWRQTTGFIALAKA